MVLTKSFGCRIQRSTACRPSVSASGVSALSWILMLNFMRPTREKSYLRGSKNMPWNSWVAVSTRRRIARAQLAVDFEQRVVLRS